MNVFSGSDLTCLRGDRLVFAGLDFRVEPGGALVLLGPNGSGKSSLLRLMAGLLKPFRGRIGWQGDGGADPAEAGERLHYVGHLDAVKPVLTALESLSFWAALGGASRPRVAAAAALDRFGIAHIAEIPGRYLSAGQKRRLALARLLAAPARLWLLDEPTVALDRAALGLLETILAEHRAAGGMVVLSTHAPLALPDASQLHLDDFAAETSADGGETGS